MISHSAFRIPHFLLILTLPLYVIDQITKWLVLQNIAVHETVPVIPGWFDLVQVHNTGAAFGMLSGNNAFFIGLSMVALVAVLVMWARGAFQGRLVSIGAALLLAGILGNLTDRFLHGFVVDFLSVDLHVRFANPWPSFNVADSCICIAAGLFVISSFFEGDRQRTREAAKQG